MAIDSRQPVSEQLRQGRDELRGIREDVSGIVADVGELFAKELQLARAELQEQVGFSRDIAIWGGVAAVAALLTLVFGALTLMFVLDLWMDTWAAALITAGVLLALTGLAAMLLMSKVKRLSIVPKRTVESVNEDVRWARSRMRFSAK